MPLKFVVLAATGVIIVVISVIAIVMSTSAGTDSCETIWKSLEGEDEEPPTS